MFTAESLRIGVRASWSLSVERLVEGPVQWRDDAKDNSPPAGLMVMKLDCMHSDLMHVTQIWKNILAVKWQLRLSLRQEVTVLGLIMQQPFL